MGFDHAPLDVEAIATADMSCVTRMYVALRAAVGQPCCRCQTIGRWGLLGMCVGRLDGFGLTRMIALALGRVVVIDVLRLLVRLRSCRMA